MAHQEDDKGKHGAKPAAERRSSRRFNSITGLSEREPFRATNVINVWPIPFINARTRASRYYYPPSFIRILPRYGLTRDDTAHLGSHARKHVQADFSNSQRARLQNLRDAKDTTYLLIRGLPALGFWPWRWMVRFPSDREFPEEQKHRDTEYVDKLRTGRPDIDPNDFNAASKQRLLEKREKLDKAFQNADFIVAGLARMVGGTVRARYENPDSPLVRNLLTDPGEQQSSDLDNIDMALRFQQSTVEKNLPKPSELTNTEESCVFRIFLCVKNLWRQSVYLLPVREVIEQHLCPNAAEDEKRKTVIKHLTEERYERRRPRSQELHREQWQPGGPVLGQGLREGDWIMSYDHERVRAMNGDPLAEEALHELREAIRRGRRDAISIPLKPGDILIVDNLRAMISRREFFPSDFWDLVRVFWATAPLPFRKKVTKLPTGELFTELRYWLFKPERWLRSYYVFRDADTTRRHATNERTNPTAPPDFPLAARQSE